MRCALRRFTGGRARVKTRTARQSGEEKSLFRRASGRKRLASPGADAIACISSRSYIRVWQQAGCSCNCAGCLIEGTLILVCGNSQFIAR
jgi:hypothetical protein